MGIRTGVMVMKKMSAPARTSAPVPRLISELSLINKYKFAVLYAVTRKKKITMLFYSNIKGAVWATTPEEGMIRLALY